MSCGRQVAGGDQTLRIAVAWQATAKVESFTWLKSRLYGQVATRRVPVKRHSE